MFATQLTSDLFVAIDAGDYINFNELSERVFCDHPGHKRSMVNSITQIVYSYPHYFYEGLWAALYELNNKGKTTHYLWFNEHRQRLFLEKEFKSWALECQRIILHEKEIIKKYWS